VSTVVPRLKLGVIFGGAGEEHPISVKSALEVARHLDQTRYEPFWIGITRAGAWRLCDGPAAGWDGAGGRPALLSADASVHGLLCFDGHQHTTTRLDATDARSLYADAQSMLERAGAGK
jgi:D-alanine--(R)-lactate ligase